jgi:hypothetical protein
VRNRHFPIGFPCGLYKGYYYRTALTKIVPGDYVDGLGRRESGQGRAFGGADDRGEDFSGPAYKNFYFENRIGILPPTRKISNFYFSKTDNQTVVKFCRHIRGPRTLRGWSKIREIPNQYGGRQPSWILKKL